MVQPSLGATPDLFQLFLGQAQHNLAVADESSQGSLIKYDWLCTQLFYAAVHLGNAYWFSLTGTWFKSHIQAARGLSLRAINPSPHAWPNHVYEAYDDLQATSRSARYRHDGTALILTPLGVDALDLWRSM